MVPSFNHSWQDGDMASYFKEIKPVRAYDAVVKQIEDAVLSGRLKPGHKLPPERELMRLLNISRRTLREALRILEQKGLIQVRLGSRGGAFVIDNVPNRICESLNLLIRQKKISTQDLTEFRIQAEGHVVELVSKRASGNDLKQLETLFTKAGELIGQETSDYDEILEIEGQMHLKLAEISGNALYTIIIKTINDALILPSYQYDPIDRSYIERAFSDWRQLIDTLRQRRGATARRLIMEHIRYFNTRANELNRRPENGRIPELQGESKR
jgi:DNA-binding FadR family transcriptional regulator